MQRQIILASVSPRRRELLKLLKIKFRAVDSGYEEIMHDHLPHRQLVKFLALGKAKAAAKKYPDSIIIAADTVVSFRGKAVGKPKNKESAFKMLKSFRGKPQDVITAAVVMDAARKKVFTTIAKSRVHIKNLSDT